MLTLLASNTPIRSTCKDWYIVAVVIMYENNTWFAQENMVGISWDMKCSGIQKSVPVVITNDKKWFT